MFRTSVVVVVGALFSLSAAAQSQTNTQAGAQASSQASAETGKTQAQTSAGASGAASASAQNEQANASLASGTAFNATLNAPVDSKKCKPGDAVTAHSTEAVKSEGRTIIPKGAKLIGHVTQASARANGEAQSSLSIVFDKAILKHGEEIPLNATIRALAVAQSSVSGAATDVDTMGGASGSTGGSGMANGRGGYGGVGSSVGGAVGTVTNTAANVGGVAGGAVNGTANAAGGIATASKGAVGGVNAEGQLTSNSQGVFGLNGLNLSAAASNSTQGALITSTGKNVHLDSGTRMLLVAQAQSGEQSASKEPTDKTEPKRESKPEPNKSEKP